MNVLILSKYPPIQGGISSRTYWLAKGLAKAGVNVHVVTNAHEVENDYLIAEKDHYDIPGVTIHQSNLQIPWHIPESPHSLSCLIEKTLEIVNSHKIDLVDTGYLIPYGIAGFLINKIKGIPYIVRHGGSDLAKFYRKGIFKSLLDEVLKNAGAILTDTQNKPLFLGLNEKVFCIPRYIPDENRFNNDHRKINEIPTFAYIGKINYYWKEKELQRIVEIMDGIDIRYNLLFLSQGRGKDDFLKFVEGAGLRNYEFSGFIHPERMPEFLQQIDFVFNFNKNVSISDFSNVICECLWSGVRLIIDSEKVDYEYSQYLQFDHNAQIISVPPDDIELAKKIIKQRVSSANEKLQNHILHDYYKYIETNINIYNKLL